MSVSELLAAEGIRLKSHRIGDQKALCPKCEGGRTHELSLSITINDDDAVWLCHRAKCGWSGSVHVRHDQDDLRHHRHSKLAPVRPAFKPKPDLLPANVIEWFSKRGIGREVLDRNQITHTSVWMPGPNAETSVIAFPYLRGGEVINVKYRDGQKHFRQEKGAEKIFFGMDNVPTDATALIVVEGEMDVLALNQVGIWNAVSVPDGAPMKVKDDQPSQEADTKFEYVWNCRDFWQRFERIVLAVDDDAPGYALQEELARRFGKERCWIVSWPDAPGDVANKDANDVLINCSPEAVQHAITSARPIPVQSLYEADAFADAVFRLYSEGRARGLSTGFTNLDPLITIRPGELSIVTGFPSSGKSEVVDAIAINMAIMHGWKFAVCSFENPPDEHIAKWAEKYIGQPFYQGSTPRMSTSDLKQAVAWIDEHFFLIRATDEAPTIDWVLEKAKVAVMRYGINGLILDPYNEFDHQRRDSQTETLYVSDMLSKIKRFAQSHGVHVWFVAHPAKPPKDQQDEAPSLYDIAGSANWVNKADVGISVHRSWDKDGSRSSVAEIHVKKVRFRAVGKPGVAKLEFLPATSRYVEVGQ